MKQTDKILMYMQTEGEITPLDALREFNCMRLAARISDLLDGIPPAKVKPVVKGEWIDFGDELDKSAGRHSYQCSRCFTDASYFISGFEWDEWTAPHFCPNCGADMRKEV